ncbi:MAG: SpoIIE family protein phosphatase [Phycisphaerae bacterium]|nr:SpoIIE family protein phosphatase [Phycisphaerae bacterium]
MRLMILENQRLRNSLKMEGSGLITIGSDSRCHVHLPDPRLGKHQANILQDDAGEWWLEVLEHSVPTCLNRAVQKNKARLRHADEIECGEFSIKFYLDPDRSREELHHDRIMAIAKSHAESLPLNSIILKDEVDLSLTRDQLERVARLTLALNDAAHAGESLPLVLASAIDMFAARRAWIAIRCAEKGTFDWALGQSQNGTPIERPRFSEITEPRCIKFAHHICTPQAPDPIVGAAMAVPIVGTKFTLGMLYLEVDPADPIYDEKSLIALKAFACAAAIPLEAVLNRMTSSRRSAAATELTVARATQDALTPKALPQWDEMQVAAYRRIGEQNCTDLYDVIQLRDKTAALLLARVHWPLHLVPCKFGEIRAAFRSAVLYGEAPHLFARALNWMLDDGNVKTRVDLAVARVWPGSGKVHLCVAGSHVIAGRVQSDGTAERIATGQTPGVGQARGTPFEVVPLLLGEGDSFVLATDGVESARNASGQAFGIDALCDIVCDGLGDTPSHVLKELATDLDEFLVGGESPEDTTVLLLRRG